MPLAHGEVHVHFYSLDVESAELQRLEQLLSADELARAKRTSTGRYETGS